MAVTSGRGRAAVTWSWRAGPTHLLATARAAFDAGDYRWVAELVNHLVFADPTNSTARELQADALEQLGYQSESATFRNAFLMGAQELRNGRMPSRPAGKNSYLEAMTVDQIFDSLAVRLRAEEVGGVNVSMNFTFTDLDERWVLRLSNRALHAAAHHDPEAAATFSLTKSTLASITEGGVTIADAAVNGSAHVVGDIGAANMIFDHLDVFMTNFALVEP